VSAVYIMASSRHGTLYVGVTSELLRRVSQHRENLRDGFTKRYGVHRSSGSNGTTRSRRRSIARKLLVIPRLVRGTQSSAARENVTAHHSAA